MDKFNYILIRIHIFQCNKIHLKMSYEKWGPFCLDPNALHHSHKEHEPVGAAHPWWPLAARRWKQKAANNTSTEIFHWHETSTMCPSSLNFNTYDYISTFKANKTLDAIHNKNICAITSNGRPFGCAVGGHRWYRWHGVTQQLFMTQSSKTSSKARR